MYSTWFSLFKNWGFPSWRGKMKVNILSCFTWNVVIAIHWGQCHSKLGLRLALVIHPIELEEVDSTNLVKNLQIVVSVILRSGRMVWDRREPGWAVVTFWTLVRVCLLTFHFEKFLTKSRKNDLHIWTHNCVRYILPAYHFIDEETEAPGIIQEIWPRS